MSVASLVFKVAVYFLDQLLLPAVVRKCSFFAEVFNQVCKSHALGSVTSLIFKATDVYVLDQRVILVVYYGMLHS